LAEDEPAAALDEAEVEEQFGVFFEGSVDMEADAAGGDIDEDGGECGGIFGLTE